MISPSPSIQVGGVDGSVIMKHAKLLIRTSIAQSSEIGGIQYDIITSPSSSYTIDADDGGDDGVIVIICDSGYGSDSCTSGNNGSNGSNCESGSGGVTSRGADDDSGNDGVTAGGGDGDSGNGTITASCNVGSTGTK